jgi:hypothetical protein
VLARRPLRLVPPEVDLSAPKETAAGSSVSIAWTGPDHPGDFVTIVPAGTPDERALALEGLVTRRVVLKLRYDDGERVTRTQSLEHGLAAAGELLALAQDLLARTHAGSRPVRLLGLTASGLERPRRDERQLSLFER